MPTSSSKPIRRSALGLHHRRFRHRRILRHPGNSHGGSAGTPQCTVNAAKIIQAQGSISATLSHEILEMLVDPWLSTVTFPQAGSPQCRTVYLHEICDPVAGYAYLIDCVTVADFVPRVSSSPDSARGGGTGPAGIATMTLQPTANGYMLVRYINTFGGINSLDSWTYIWGAIAPSGRVDLDAAAGSGHPATLVRCKARFIEPSAGCGPGFCCSPFWPVSIGSSL